MGISLSAAPPRVWVCALALSLLPLRGGAQERPARPDISRLPEIDDLSEEQARREAPLPQPPVIDEPPRMAMPYLGQMLSEPEIDFVPSTPTAGLNPHAVWEG